MARILVDIDGVLCSETGGDYQNAMPYPDAIAALNQLYDAGHEIIVYTSRYMGREHGDAFAVNKYRHAIQEQLRQWGVRYAQLITGKQPCDILIDDRAVFWQPDWPAILAEIEKRTHRERQTR